MELIAITPAENYYNETEIVNRLFFAGLDKLHLRKPEFSYLDYKKYLSHIHPQYLPKVVVHGSWELYHQQMAGGIHFRAALRGSSEAEELLKNTPRAAVSTSFHSWQEVVHEGEKYGSVFISPLFDSISKQGYKAAVLAEGITAAKATLISTREYCPKIIGLGGVNKETVSILKNSGYDGAAILGAIWQAPDPLEAFKIIRTVAKQN